MAGPRVWLAEKPSAGRAIAKALGGGKPKGRWGLATGKGTVVWARGHLLENAKPEAYDPGWTWGPFGVACVPFKPRRWKMVPRDAEAKVQLDAIVQELRGAEDTVVATDAGREGELIARSILDYAGLLDEMKLWRLWVRAMNDQGIRDAIANLMDGKEKDGLYAAGLERQRSDWLLGMNSTLVLTELCLPRGTRGVALSAGRVQTPTLAIVVDREEEIRVFVVEPFFKLEGMAQTTDGAGNPVQVKLVHAPKPLLKDRAQAQALQARCAGHQGPVKVEKKDRKQGPPAPLSLSKLQQWMSAKKGWGAQKTLDVAQKLYDQGMVTYPRTSGTAYDPVEWDDSEDAWDALSEAAPQIAAGIPPRGKRLRRSGVFSAKALEGKDHGALRSTGSVTAEVRAAWNADEVAVFDVVAAHFAAQACPDWEFAETKMSMDVDGVAFQASGRVTRAPGWKAVLDVGKAKPKDGEAAEPLPDVRDGTQGKLDPVTLQEGKTKPPPAYKEGTLVKEMQRVGIGTEATYAATIETLKRRGYCTAGERGLVKSSACGAKVIGEIRKAAPELARADETARLEAQLDALERDPAKQPEVEQALTEYAFRVAKKLKDGPLGLVPVPVRPKWKGYQKKGGKKGGAKGAR